MRATLDWSHTLLTRDEQVLLRRLAVFSGGFVLEAAEEVAGEGVDVFSALGGLVEQSLVVPAGETYRVLEPVRQYAADHLAAAGEADEVADRHAEHVLALARDAREGLRGPEQAAWLDRLQASTATCRRHSGTSSTGDAAATPRGSGPTRGSPGRCVAARARRCCGCSASSRAPARRRPPTTSPRCTWPLAGLRFATGDIAGMRASAAEAVAASRDGSSRDRLADSLVMLGSSALLGGDFETAAQALREAVADAAGDGWALAHARTAQGQLGMVAGDLAASAASLADAEELARELGSPFTLATVLNVQASLARLQGRDERALEHLLEAGWLAVEVKTTWPLVYTLPALGALAAERDLPELATLLFAAGAATAEGSSLAVAFPPDVERAEQQLAAVRARLGDDEFRRVWARGRRLGAEEAVRLTEQLAGAPRTSRM